MWAPAQSEAEHGRLATSGQLCGLLPTHQHHPQPCSWRGETISNCIIKNEMKCTGDLEIIHEIVLDTSITNYFVQYLGIPTTLLFNSACAMRMRKLLGFSVSVPFWTGK